MAGFSRRRVLAGIAGALLVASLPACSSPPEVLAGTPANRIAEAVFQRLLATPIGQSAARPRGVILIANPSVNSFIGAGAYLYVTKGLAEVLGNSPGLWAAVLGHEIGHIVIAPGARPYLPRFQQEVERAYFAAPEVRREAGVPSELRVATRRPGSKQDEYMADRVALLMMAQAGYHPDFAIALYRRLETLLGDRSRFGELFSDHPRWRSREERDLRTRGAALAIFHSRWQDAARSPGGVPPDVDTRRAALER